MAPETIVLISIVFALTLYALLGGADFGAGVWEFNTALRATEKERKFVHSAMGPVWEANHVWLIFVLVAMFGAFPIAFAGLCRALWLPLLLALLGIVFRGVGFIFHSYTAGAARQQAVWGAVFAFASAASPFFLGACAGAIAAGRLAINSQGEYNGDYLTGWISPLAIFSAFFAVAVCSYLAAVFLARDAWRSGDADLTALWRQRALVSGAWLGILALAGLTILAIDAPEVWAGFQQRAWPFVIGSVLTGITSLALLWKRHFTSAAATVMATVTTVVWGWAVAQYPMLVPPEITIAAAKSPDTVLWAMIAALTACALIVGPSLALLLFLFKGTQAAPPTTSGAQDS